MRVFALVFAAGLVALLCVGLLERRSEAFTLGIQPATAVYAGDGSTVCQGPIEVVEDFAAVRLTLGAAVVASPSARVEVRDAASGRGLAGGTIRGGRPSSAEGVRVDVGPVAAGRRVRVCIRVTGRGGLLVYGNAGAAARGSEATVNGLVRDFDADMVFLRANDASVLSLTGAMVSRASLFHGGWVGPWTIWALLALSLTAFPVLLGAALARSREREGQPTGSASE